MGEGRFDPRDLIMLPFRTCPQCGKTESGVHDIQGGRVLRRCRACWHHHFVSLPPVRKKIIHLDQFVISNFVKLTIPTAKGHERVYAIPFWREAYGLLTQLRSLEMICCPDSLSHQQESNISTFNDQLKKMYKRLSGGITFEQFDGIEMMQIA